MKNRSKYCHCENQTKKSLQSSVEIALLKGLPPKGGHSAMTGCRYDRIGYILLVFLILLVNLLPANAFARIEKQYLFKGQAKSIETDYDIGDVAVSDNSVCDFMITDSRQEVYLNPVKEGSITLTIWDAMGKKRDVIPIEVLNRNLDKIMDEASRIFENTNVKVVISGKQIVLKGRAETKIVLEQARSMAERYPEIISDVSMSGEVLDTISAQVEQKIGTPGIKVRNIQGRIVLDGIAYSGKSMTRAVEIARLYDENPLNLIEVRETGRRPGRDDLVQLDVYFLEIKKEVMRSMGIRWSPGAMPKSEDEGTNSGMLDSVAGLGKTAVGFAMNLIPKLNFLREKGGARVLDNTSIVVKSGENADFFNGSQIPYYSSEQVVFKDVGIRIHAEPIATDSDVDLKIDASLSSPSANIESGIDTRNISTSSYIGSGEAVVLANMVSNREVTTYNRKPNNLDTSSVLFNLILSKDFQSGRSEFFVIVKPTIINKVMSAQNRLREYLEIEKDMIGTRSKKELNQYLEKNGEAPNKKQISRRRRKTW